MHQDSYCNIMSNIKDKLNNRGNVKGIIMNYISN